MKTLQSSDLLKEVQDGVSVQSYAKKQVIDGVRIVEIRRMAGEDGTFEEVARLNEKGCLESVPDFQVRQVNRSMLLPGAVKAWHLHFNQEDIWYVAPDDHMLLGLWDVRAESSTKGAQMRITLGAGTSKLVYIPRGVAHGVANIGKKKGTILYLVNQQFNLEDPDERRLNWDAAGAEFWTPEKG